MRKLLLGSLALGLLVSVSFSLTAQLGDGKDSANEKQVPRVPAEKIPPSPFLTPEEALKSFRLQPGFHIELVAGDPLVHDPVAMTFDPNGRLWVVEMSNYMPDLDGNGEDKPLGKVVVLEDTDGDGKMDKRTVFQDNLVMPRALSLVRDGVLIAEPPHLWFCRDTNGDLKADEKREVYKDYGDTKSPEHTANGLLWGLDNWIYSADWTTRIKSLPEDDWKREPTAFRGQWGISQDDFGRLVYDSNSDQYRMDLVPSQYLQRNPNFTDAVGLNVDPIRNQTVWPARVNPGVNRAYREGTLRPDGTLISFTAACGPVIYRGDNFPAEFYGNAFVCEPSANLVKRNILEENDGRITGRQAYTNAEFLASTDERFRPVSLYNGPDGALYVVDMYHGVLQHKLFLTTYLRGQMAARGMDKPLGAGRIYRITHGPAKKPAAKPALLKASVETLVTALSQTNAWWRETAQRLLVEKADAHATPLLQKLATSGPNPLARLHALWTLEGMDALDIATVRQAMADPHPKVRAAALRLSEKFLGTELKKGLLIGYMKTVNDRSADVQLQMAFTLGEAKDPLADSGLALIARNYSTNEYIRDAVLTGLGGRELEFAKKLLADPAWKDERKGLRDFLGSLARCICAERKPDRIGELLTATANASLWQREALLQGIAAAVPVARKGKPAPVLKPVKFTAAPSGWTELNGSASKPVQDLLAKISPLFVWPGKPGYEAPAAVKALTAEEQKRFDAGKELYAATCAACHQPTGRGLEGLAPPLVDSEWALGPDGRIIRIVLHGLRGPVSVKGKTYEMEMPSLSVFDDEQVADVLTYVRREWEHTAAPVSPETVKAIRAETAQRQEAWTDAELQKVK